LDELDVAPPSCVLVEILMPEVDGLALLREMRHAGSDVPAVFMTGTGHVPTVVEAMKEGALDLLSKPFTADSLCAAIARATDSSRRTHGERRDLVDLWRQVEKLEQMPFVKLDGVEARRPRAADIITDVLARERSQSQKQA
jgi:two-component system response regulator FixJ